jgi:hypothetical protein
MEPVSKLTTTIQKTLLRQRKASGHTQFIDIMACDIIYIAKTDPQFAIQCTVHLHVNETPNKHKIDTESHHLLTTK